MPIATLLLREKASTSLTSIVEKSQRKQPPFTEYELQLNECRLGLVPKADPSCVNSNTKSASSKSAATNDEGFESDIDSLSIISSDDSYTSSNLLLIHSDEAKTPETDSANGSASSDSDTEIPHKTEIQIGGEAAVKETHHLVDCVCYTDVKFPHLLLFVIKNEVLVFKFAALEHLQSFYIQFTALKAVTNQKAYNTSNISGGKFNLLHRTDNNGVTHIEITREAEPKLYIENAESSIISLKTPENFYNDSCMKVIRDGADSKHAKTEAYEVSTTVADVDNMPKDGVLRKVWNSAEDLLEVSAAPKRPERRRKLKGKAPAPPAPQNDVFKGQYVRVQVTPSTPTFEAAKTQKLHPLQPQSKSKLTSYQQFKTQPPSIMMMMTSSLNRPPKNQENWTNSVPRMLKKPRSRSETRNFQPMAYRYIDTTSSSPPQSYGTMSRPYSTNVQTISNRLFGMSSKLKDFSRFDDFRGSGGRWGSLSELSFNKGSDGSLKSVIKKDDNNNRRRTNEKKVTFSAYTTVQVV